MKVIEVDEILERLELKYGDLTDETGCYCKNYETGENEWLSVVDIVNVIKECDTIDI